MPLEFRLPDVGEGIDAAEIMEWKVRVGEEVEEDAPLVEVETDKAIVAISCPTSGVILKLGAEVGDTVHVGEILAVFGSVADLGEADSVENSSAASNVGDDNVKGNASAAAVETEAKGERSTNPKRPDAVIGIADAAATAAGRPLASPAVRRMAREGGVDLSHVEGGGPGGRIRREDVEAAALAIPDEAERDDASAKRPDAIQPLRGIRRSIARTLTHSWQTIPHVIDYREAEATALVDLRQQLRVHAERAGDPELARALTLTPLLVKIAATLLGRHRRLNAAVDMEREEIRLHGAVNVGIATATSEGLLVPVIHAADGKSLHEIALKTAELTTAARSGQVSRADLTGATFTLNNYGALGVWLGTPIIGPDQAANLGVGRLERRPVANEGEVVVRPVLTLACAADHRLIDGDILAYFVSDVVGLIEEPSLLLQELH